MTIYERDFAGFVLSNEQYSELERIRDAQIQLSAGNESAPVEVKKLKGSE